jgi:hypothetical protein
VNGDLHGFPALNALSEGYEVHPVVDVEIVLTERLLQA